MSFLFLLKIVKIFLNTLFLSRFKLVVTGLILKDQSLNFIIFLSFYLSLIKYIDCHKNKPVDVIRIYVESNKPIEEKKTTKRNKD